MATYSKYLDNKNILVTGGTGTFGSEFIKTIISKYNPNKVIVYSRDEMKQYKMQQTFPDNNIFPIRYFLGDVRDKERLIMATKGVDIIIHAAALKHITSTEYNPFEAIKTNILGAQNIIEASLENKVKRVIALSTDKASAPINLYGATKLASDKLFVAANSSYRGQKDISFSVVRYGNVFGSRGSVVPFFLSKKEDQIIPITDEKMTRFSITIEQSVNFVLSTLQRMQGGEIFIPKMSSYKLLDLKQAIVPKNKIQIIGIRPGEKLHEETVTVSDSLNTIDCGKYYVILPSSNFLTKSMYDKKNKIKSKSCEYGFSYNSHNNSDWLTVDKLKILVKEFLEN
tara:strand:+ start:6246 stop:7268 length:1023 start_codon:yes stop_codon:yes gene_type:complete